MDELIEMNVDCPYCGEQFVTLVDTSGGASEYIEDCVVCCQPIEFDLYFDSDGEPRLSVRRGDE